MKTFLTLLLFFVLLGTAQGATYWVSKSGKNGQCTNSASPQTTGAELTIAAGLACLNSGDTLNLRTGTYDEIITAAQITSNTTIRGYDGAANVVIARTASNFQTINLGSANHVTLDSLTINGTTTTDDPVILGDAGSSYNTIQNSVIYSVDIESGNAACINAQGTNHSALNNTITHCGAGRPGGPPPAHGIYWTNSNNIARGNTITNVLGYGVQIWGHAEDLNVDNNLVTQNRIDNAGAGGVVIGSQSNVAVSEVGNVISNNVISNSYRGVRVYGWTDGLVIANNSIYNSGDTFAFDYATNLIIRNNILFGSAPWGVNSTTYVQDHNYCNANAGCTGTGSTNSDTSPFVNAAGGDFTLNPNVAGAINAGADLGSLYNTDYAGNARGYGGAWDIGAYEYVGEGGPPAGQDLVLALSFDEGSGTAAADSSGLANNATLQNGTTWATGKYGSAVSFDGISNYVEIPHQTSLNLLPHGMTLEAWVKPTSVVRAWQTVIFKQPETYWAFAMSGGSGSCGSTNAAYGGFSTTQYLYSCDDTPLSTTNWTHVAVTYDGSTIRYYRNGQLINSINTSENLPTGTDNLLIGADNIGDYFSGLIDEVRIYQVARTPTEIQTDMNTPIAAELPPGEQPPTVKIAPASSFKVGASSSVKIGVP